MADGGVGASEPMGEFEASCLGIETDTRPIGRQDVRPAQRPTQVDETSNLAPSALAQRMHNASTKMASQNVAIWRLPYDVLPFESRRIVAALSHNQPQLQQQQISAQPHHMFNLIT